MVHTYHPVLVLCLFGAVSGPLMLLSKIAAKAKAVFPAALQRRKTIELRKGQSAAGALVPPVS